MATLRDAKAELDITHSLFGVGYSISDLESSGLDLTDQPTGFLPNKLRAKQSFSLTMRILEKGSRAV